MLLRPIIAKETIRACHRNEFPATSKSLPSLWGESPETRWLSLRSKPKIGRASSPALTLSLEKGEEDEFAHWLLDKGWIPPGEAKDYVNLADIKEEKIEMGWTEEELKARLKENPHLKVSNSIPLNTELEKMSKGKSPSKYKNIRSEYNGVKFASKKEAHHAQENDTRIKAGILSFYLIQVPFRLPGGIVYRADFAEFSKVSNTHLYEVEFIDVKGFDTPISDLKRKQVKELYGIEIKLL